MLSSRIGGSEKRLARESCAAENWAVEKPAEVKRGEEDSGDEDNEVVDDVELLRWLREPGEAVRGCVG